MEVLLSKGVKAFLSERRNSEKKLERQDPLLHY